MGQARLICFHSGNQNQPFCLVGWHGNLWTFDLSGFKPMRFEFEPKAAALNMRLPQNLLDALKSKAKAKGVPYTRYVRLLLENDVAG